MPRKGWFKIRGVQDGDRTLDMQLKGLEPLLAEVQGLRVLDLGCAEGLIARECARRGAAHVTGIEIVLGHVEEARRQCAGLPCGFIALDVEKLVANQDAGDPPLNADVVLALAVLHKLKRPEITAAYIARTAKRLAVVRYPGGQNGVIWDARSGDRPIDVAAIMKANGLALERTEKGPLGELTAYFRR